MTEQVETVSPSPVAPVLPDADDPPASQSATAETRFGVVLGVCLVAFVVLLLFLTEGAAPAKQLLPRDLLVRAGSPATLRADFPFMGNSELLKDFDSENNLTPRQQASLLTFGKLEEGQDHHSTSPKTAPVKVSGRYAKSGGKGPAYLQATAAGLDAPGVYAFEFSVSPVDSRAPLRFRAPNARIHVQALSAGQKLILVDIESALATLTGRAFEGANALDMGAVPGAAEVLNGFYGQGRAIVYVYQGPGKAAAIQKVHAWLTATGFPPGAVLLSIKEPTVLSMLKGNVEATFGNVSGISNYVKIPKNSAAPWAEIESKFLHIWGRAK